MKMTMEIVAAIFVLSASAHTAGADATYFDGTFNNADWQVSMLFQGYNGGNVTGTQVSAGGNPGAYRTVDTSVNPIGSNPYSNVLGFQQRLGDTYDPTVQGAISTIDFAIDFLNLNTFGDGQQYEVALSQNGSLYVPFPHLTTTLSGWRHDSSTGLTANDFFWLHGSPPFFDPSQHPDFSASGAPISLGFYTKTATTDVPFTLTVGYDNWSVTAHSTPEPSTLILAALGGLTLLALRRRR